jgi:hypothetical protein
MKKKEKNVSDASKIAKFVIGKLGYKSFKEYTRAKNIDYNQFAPPLGKNKMPPEFYMEHQEIIETLRAKYNLDFDFHRSIISTPFTLDDVLNERQENKEPNVDVPGGIVELLLAHVLTKPMINTPTFLNIPVISPIPNFNFDSKIQTYDKTNLVYPLNVSMLSDTQSMCYIPFVNIRKNHQQTLGDENSLILVDSFTYHTAPEVEIQMHKLENKKFYCIADKKTGMIMFAKYWCGSFANGIATQHVFYITSGQGGEKIDRSEVYVIGKIREAIVKPT